ncbi:MAG: hypothetical protein R3A79_06830 [Nannocystaceae bacterium]
MPRLAGLAALTFACVACGPSKGQPSTPASDSDVNPASARPSAACPALGGDATTTLRLVSQGSHALARADLTLSLDEARMRGEDFILEGNDPRALPVDQAVDPAVIAELRATLATLCAPRTALRADSAAAPGGASAIEVTEADGASFWIVPGAAQVAAPATVAAISVDDWKRLLALWPASAGK